LIEIEDSKRRGNMTEGMKRTRKSANYVLEQMAEPREDDSSVVWREVKDEFISPEKALDYAKENKILGAIRVVRVASPVYGGAVVVADPVYTLARIDEVPTEKKTRKPRKSRKVSAPTEGTASVVSTTPVTTVALSEPSSEEDGGMPALSDDDILPPDPDALDASE
jgi:hypothetical protein